MTGGPSAAGIPIYIDPETGMWRACTDPERSSVMSTKKSTTKKSSHKIDLEQTITAIVRKYVVVRDSPLGPVQYIPYGKIADLIKDIHQLVLDYIASLPKKKIKPEEFDEEMEKTTKKIWDKIKKDLDKKIKKDDEDVWKSDPFDPYRRGYGQPGFIPAPIVPRPGFYTSGDIRDNIRPQTRG
jgi:hypothetical protein